MQNICKKTFADRVSSLCSWLGNCRSGAAAVEFAIVGPVFLVLVFSALELGMVLIKVTLLENAANEISRDIYIGNVSSDDAGKTDVKDQICKNLSVIMRDCENNLAVEVTRLDGLQSVPEYTTRCENTGNPEFEPGKAEEIVFVRVCLTLTPITPGIGLSRHLKEVGSGAYQISAALAFANEPY